MVKHSFIATSERVVLMLEITAIVLMLILASLFQIVYQEIPCPLCLLQRIGFFGVILGFLMNLRFGLRPSHFSIALISALFTSFVALRQIALHVVPGTGAYGDPVFGYHLYTWSFIVSMVIVVVTTVMLGFDRQYQRYKKIPMSWVVHVLFAIVVALVLVNIVTTFKICGFVNCAEPSQQPIPIQFRYPL